MNLEQLKSQIQQQAPTFLRPAKKKGYVCPVCHNGTGKKGDGITKDTSDPTAAHYKCFTCGLYADVITLFGKQYNIPSFTEQIEAAAAYYGLSVPEHSNYTHNNIHTTAYTQETSYKIFFEDAHRHLQETDYHLTRGISDATAARFQLGYVADWRHPKAPNAPPSPRLIIPTSEYSYLARDTRPTLTDEEKKYSKSKAGQVRIFNAKALHTATKPIFVVEGELDALSIIEVGGEAIALGSTANRQALLTLLDSQRPTQPLIITMDNDTAGQQAAKELIDGLQARQIPHYRLSITDDCKDANELLQQDKDALAANVAAADHIEDEAKDAARAAYLTTNTAHYIQRFIDGITDSIDTPYTPTGFPKLDAELDGGFYEGLYIIGAISSLGKTTLITQIADQIAQAGGDTLIVSLEMARAEIMAKSISRHTLEGVLATSGDIRNAKTTRGITTGKRYTSYSPTERTLITDAIRAYGTYANHLYIHEGMGDIGVAQVRDAVANHVAITGKAPVVIIDYLQILAPHNERATDKQNTDKAVMELKRISRDYKTPVIAISSFNRQNYKEAVTMEAFKESGAVEYSSDVLIGLQLQGAGNKDFSATEEKRKDPRHIELIILKNRNGRAGGKIGFSYYPLFNYFKED